MDKERRVLLVSANLSSFEKTYIDDIKHIIDGKFKVSTLYLNDENFPPRMNSLHPRLQAKIPKMLAWEYFSDYDYYLWLDGAYRFSNENSLNNILNLMCVNDFSIVKHWDRGSIRDEFEFIDNEMKNHNQYLINRYKNELMSEQVNLYLTDSEFIDDSLYAGGFFMYSKKLTLKKPNFFKDWFYHCARYSIQDQLSLPYLLWKHKINPKILSKEVISENLIHQRIG